MKILLYNDNPVVRKLVALSAQKTKDELNVIWSVDELDNGSYDLLIVDDALYSDEVMAELKSRIPFKTTLMMATRGSSVPAGFDKVIHKPFLPTDLVDLFSQIEKSITSVSEEPAAVEKVHAINLEDELVDDSDTIAIDDLPDLGDLDEESAQIKTNILDHEEVQEVQSLLDDEEDAYSLDEDLLEGLGDSPDTALIDDIDEVLDEIEEEGDASESDESLHLPEMDDLDSLLNDFAEAKNSDGLDDELLSEAMETEADTTGAGEEDLEALLAGLDGDLQMDDSDSMEREEALASAAEAEEEFDDLMIGMDEEIPEAMEEAPTPAVIPEMDDLDGLLDELTEEETSEEGLLDDAEIESMAAAEIEDEPLLDDEGLDELEQQIKEAVDDLDLGDLDMELGDDELGELGIEKMGDLDSLDGLDGLEGIDEREMKIAVGESVEDEPEVRIGKGENASLHAEALSEVLEDDIENVLSVKEEAASENAATPADGVEALQVLLKTLSNEEVVKSLKGLNISININFGNNS